MTCNRQTLEVFRALSSTPHRKVSGHNRVTVRVFVQSKAVIEQTQKRLSQDHFAQLPLERLRTSTHTDKINNRKGPELCLFFQYYTFKSGLYLETQSKYYVV